MKMVWAVIRSSKVEAVGRALKDIEIRGCTVFPVRGYGEEWRVYEPLIHGGHHKVEVIVEDDKADRVSRRYLSIRSRAWAAMAFYPSLMSRQLLRFAQKTC